jgi:thiol-disulfide isomerase/thioredoxin
LKAGIKVGLVALLAGTLGAAASLLTTGPGPLLRSEFGQRWLGALLAARAPAAPPGLAIAQPGAAIPAFSVPGLDGHPVAVPTAYAGRPLLINVWASWCRPCVQEMPELQRFSAQQGGNGVQVVGIALDDAAAVRAFLPKVGVAYPVLIDAPGPTDAGVRLGNRAGVLPYSVLVSADGRLLKQHIGPFARGDLERWTQP